MEQFGRPRDPLELAEEEERQELLTDAVTRLSPLERALIADKLEDLSTMLTHLSERGDELTTLARADEVRRPSSHDPRGKPGRTPPIEPLFAALPPPAPTPEVATNVLRALPRGRSFH